MYKDRASPRDPDAVAARLRDLARVRKLLRLAEDQDGRPEGRAARARADELLARHGLSRATLPDDDLGVDFRHRRFAVGPASVWRQTLVHAIADYFDCVALHQQGSGEVETWGAEHVLPQVEYTYVVYLRHLRTAWAAHVEALEADGVWGVLTRRQQVDARDGFCIAFTLGVKQRLAEDRAADEREAPQGREVSARQREELARWMRRGGVRWKDAPQQVGRVDGHGYRAGLEAEVDAALQGRGGTRRLEG